MKEIFRKMKPIVFFISLLMLFMISNSEVKAIQGAGTTNDPYKIYTVSDLRLMKADSKGCYILMNDIDLNNEPFETISFSGAFNGVFDGNNYNIKNLNLISSDGYYSLFKSTKDATIKNIHIENVTMTINPDVSVIDAGGVTCAATNTKFINCSVSGIGSINGIWCGGLVAMGWDSNSFTDCSVSGISISGSTVGGIVGSSDNDSLTRCYTSANISGDHFIGGLIGNWGTNSYRRNNLFISNCYTTGNISYTESTMAEKYVGGLVGYSSTNIYDTSTINISISDSYTTGDINGLEYAGALIGYERNESKYIKLSFSNCFSLSNITANKSSGLSFALGDFTVTNCYFAGKLYGDEKYGLTNRTMAVTNSYFNGEINGVKNYTNSKLTSAMIKKVTYVNWDFSNKWKIDEGISYPYLKNLPMPDKAIVYPIDIPVTSIAMSPLSSTLEIGEVLQLTYFVAPENASDRLVTFTTSNPSVATVNNIGRVVALSEGTTTILAATSNGMETECTITVNSSKNPDIPVQEITLSPSAKKIFIGDTLQINSTIAPSDATNKNITWTSSDPSVLTVNEDGFVSAVSSGFAAIVALTESGSYMAFCNIMVEEPPIPIISVTGIEIPNTLSLNVGEEEQLQMQISPVNATNKNIIWLSSDTSIVSIDKNGYMNAMGVGTVTITAITLDGQYTSTCVVTVNDEILPPENLASLAKVSASSEYNQNYSANKVIDGNENTRWMAADNNGNTTLELDFEQQVTLNQILINEFGARIGDYALQIWNGLEWIDIYSGSRIGSNFIANVNTVTTNKIRLLIKTMLNDNRPSIYSFEIYRK